MNKQVIAVYAGLAALAISGGIVLLNTDSNLAVDTTTVDANNRRRFLDRIESVQVGKRTIVFAVQVDGKTATVTVEKQWSTVPRAGRIDVARALWKSWASIASPENPDEALIRIVDSSGKDVGGSVSFGSNIVLPDD